MYKHTSAMCIQILINNYSTFFKCYYLLDLLKDVLLVGLYGCETCCLTLTEEHKLSVREHGVEENIWTKEGWSDGRVEKTA
jgi:hypothetical protein